MADTLNIIDDRPDSARAFVPGHITGFFRIFDDDENPLQCGSIGAGFSVEIGTFTTVSVEDNQSLDITTIYNDKRINAEVTKTVVKKMAREYNKKLNVVVRHESSLPSGAGFGASGAGALGTALALGHLLDPSIDTINAAKFAHIAEIENHTGLGDVIAQTMGGFEIRVHHGSPGIGQIVRMNYPKDLQVVLAGAPGLETKDVLTSSKSRMKINSVGDRLVERLAADQNLETFIACSREFTNAIGLQTKRVKKVLTEFDDLGLSKSSMVMLGDSVFCFCNSKQVELVESILGSHWKQSQITTTSISEKGGRLVSW